MSAREDMADGLAEIENDILNADSTPLTFTWPAVNGSNYPCNAGAGSFNKTLGEGGWATEANRTLVVRQDLFNGGAGPFPDRNQKVIFDGYTYSIDDVDKPPGNAFLVLKLIDPTKGA